MMISDMPPRGRPSPTPGVGGGRTGSQFTINLASQTNAADDLQVALTAFKAEARKTPRERCRDQVMREWHLTQEYIDSLPPTEAQALNERIEQEVSRRMQTAAPHCERKPGETDPPVDNLPVDAAPPEQATSTMQALGARAQSSVSK